MANTLGLYDPLFYANLALIQLEKVLGMAGRIHRGYDKSPQQKGSTIQIRRPSTFVAQDAPSAPQDLAPEMVSVKLDNWREVKFPITDKELSYTQEDIIREHIRPMAVALADDIDQKLVSLYQDVPWHKNASTPAAVSDVTSLWQQLFDNKAPQSDGMSHLMLSGTTFAELLNLQAFSQFQGAGPSGAETQRTGDLGFRYGFNIFANQNTPSHTAGSGVDNAGAVNGAHVKGAETVAIDGLTNAETFEKGDTFVIAGDTQRYALTAPATVTANAITASISPVLQAAVADNAVVTFDRTSATQGMAFHRNAFALAMAPLSDHPKELGARVETVSDPITNLSLRSRVYYLGNTSETHVALDVLYGFTALDPNLAIRYRDAA